MGNLASSRPQMRLVIMGLDGAGKTTVLYRLKCNHFVQATPTVGFNCERVRLSEGLLRGQTVELWDLGGQDRARPLWQQYLRSADGFIFVIDLLDQDRLDDARLELMRVMKHPENAGIPVEVLLNKMDLPGGMEPVWTSDQLHLDELGPENRMWGISRTCAVTGEGLDTAIEHLHAMITQRREVLRRHKASIRPKSRWGNM